MSQAEADSSKYYIPHDTQWPIIGSIALFTLMLGAVSLLNEWTGATALLPGFLLLAFMFVGWFNTVIDESQRGMFNDAVDRSFRMGMIWFIFSEVMFFAAFFGALFYAREFSVPWIGGEGTKVFNKLILWPDYTAGWPSNGPAHLSPRTDGSFEVIPAFGLPAVNTMLLLTSGATITIAHHALKENKRGILNVFLALTFLLGFLFVYLQAQEYAKAYHEKGLQLGTGIYGGVWVGQDSTIPNVRGIRSDVVAALKSPKVQELYAAQDAQAVGSSPAEFATRIRDELARWRIAVRAANLKLD